MKNKSTFILAILIFALAVIGCSSINPLSDTKSGSNTPGSNKSLTDKAVDTAVGEQKIGIPECDQVMDMLAAEANSPDDNFVTKAVKQTFLNKIRDSIKQSIEENKNDKVELAKNCKELKTQLENYKAEDASKK